MNITKEFILFWILATGGSGSQRGFDEKGCAEAAHAMFTKIIAYAPIRDAETYVGGNVVTRVSLLGTAWCQPAVGK